MRTRTLAILVLVLCALANRGVAKAPHVMTVVGPGVDGEVDLRPLVNEGLERLLLPLARDLTDRIDPPAVLPLPAFTFAWYSVGGDPPTPGIDRLVYYPGASSDAFVEVVETSPMFVPESALGWYRVEGAEARALDHAVALASRDGMRGALGYAFEPADGSDYSKWWVPVGGEPLELSTAKSPGQETVAPAPAASGLGGLLVLGLIGGGLFVVRVRWSRATRANALR